MAKWKSLDAPEPDPAPEPEPAPEPKPASHGHGHAHAHPHEPKAEAPPKVDPRDDLIAQLKAELGDLMRQLQLAQAKVPPPPAVSASHAGPVGDTSLPLWRVSLNAPTPLTHKVMLIHAADMHQAKGFFCAANGISDSRHDWKIERADQAARGDTSNG